MEVKEVDGQVLVDIFTDEDLPGYLSSPDSDDRVTVADYRSRRILRGRMLTTFSDVHRHTVMRPHGVTGTRLIEPLRLSLDSEGRVSVLDRQNHRIVLLNSELQLQRVLVEVSQFQLWWPARFYYDERTSQLYVAHCTYNNSQFSPNSDTISLFILPGQ